jgi:hypothetical protein
VQQVQRFSKLVGFGSVAKPAIAGLLAFLVLAAVTFSASHNLHKSLHTDDSAASHGCLVCSLVSGQLSAVDVAVIALVIAFGFAFFVLLLQSPVLPGHDFRLAPSRAPPRS